MQKDVYVSLNGTKLCHQMTADVVIYGYSSDDILELFYLDTYPINDHSAATFKTFGCKQ